MTSQTQLLTVTAKHGGHDDVSEPCYRAYIVLLFFYGNKFSPNYHRHHFVTTPVMLSRFLFTRFSTCYKYLNMAATMTSSTQSIQTTRCRREQRLGTKSNDKNTIAKYINSGPATSIASLFRTTDGLTAKCKPWLRCDVWTSRKSRRFVFNNVA